MDGYSELQKWSNTPVGRAFLSAEKTRLRETLAHQFGFHLVFSGEHSCADLLQDTPILHRMVLTPTPVENLSSLAADLEALPFLTESVDLLILQHCLEFSPNPHAVLQEAARVLLSEGRLVIFLFNPVSLWGLYRLFKSKRAHFPWFGHFYSRSRVVDWLKLLGFAEFEMEDFFLSPNFLEKNRFIRRLGLGCGYRVVAKKRQACVTSTRIFAPAKRRLVITGLAPSG